MTRLHAENVALLLRENDPRTLALLMVGEDPVAAYALAQAILVLTGPAPVLAKPENGANRVTILEAGTPRGHN